METFLPFLAYASALGLAAAIPGPGVAAVIGRALGSGTRASLPFVVGLALGDVAFLTAAVLGLSALASTTSGAFLVVKVLGGLYLLWLAWRLWTAPAEGTSDVPPHAPRPSTAMLSGLAVTLGNPKTVVFYLALLPNVLDLEDVDLRDWLALSLLTMVVLLGVLVPYAALATRLRYMLTRPAALRRLNRCAAVLVGGAGALILRDAVRRI